jgi:hypothetical protein
MKDEIGGRYGTFPSNNNNQDDPAPNAKEYSQSI